ncbi:hypothetical protein [Dyella flagellata]|uniref:Uncharacterized protein n=1 Tax=Dyella flagellata TaxID=1867833 RepID=A0ABQ5XE42_9GAMM|nr:hypothetical protein [Dyella flagellata]GLQ89924.1 hypothetical protein GCM10007898_34990 [Dyella flagellata]
MNQSERPVFFAGQYLSADDLTAAVLYEHVQTARHGLGAHTWGIAIGLDLVERSLPSGAVDVAMMPGVAWDGYGQAVVVAAPVKLSVNQFANFLNTSDNGDLIKVWLRYKEAATPSTPQGFALCSGDTSNRIAETYEVVAGDPTKGSHDTITVAGRQLDARTALQQFDADAPIVYDESIPFQQFPEAGDKRRWLIPIGMVRWFQQGNQPGQFVPRDDSGGASGQQAKDSDTIRAFRQYLGVVAESLQAADGAIRLRDRYRDPQKAKFQPPLVTDPSANDLVWVEGHLRVLGDARLVNGMLDFRAADGQRDGVPEALRRVDGNKAGGSDLQVLFAAKDGATGKNAFAVGNVNVDSKGALQDIVPFLTVRDNGLTCIGGTTTPVATLQVAGDLALDKIKGGSPLNLVNNATLIWNDGSTLWLNANLDQSKLIDGVRALGEFACDSLNIGGMGSNNNWSDPGAGNAWFAGSVAIGTTTLDASLVIQGAQDDQGMLRIFGNGGDFVYDGGKDKLFVFNNTGNITAFLGGTIGIGTTSPNAQLHVANNLQVDAGASISGSLSVSGNPSLNPVLALHSQQADQGNMSFFSNGGDIEYDGGSDQLFVIKNNGNVTSFMGGSIGIGTTNPLVNLQVEGDFYATGAVYAQFKPFLIPHPKDATGKYLVHCAIEGPEAAVYYRGESQLAGGIATVALPDYFEPLTLPTQRTVQITPIYEANEPISSLASSAVRNGSFNVRMITPDNPSQRFYWEVKAVRADVPALQVERPASSALARR